MKLPQILRTGKPLTGDRHVTTLAQARKHIEGQGGTVEADTPFEGPRWNVKVNRGLHHGGVTTAQLIEIAEEDARKVAKRRVPAGKGKRAK